MYTEEKLNRLPKEVLIGLVMSLQRDKLTGVYKREALETIVKKNYVVALIDIDRLKQVNDTYGHEKGDEYILSVVSSIKDAVRKKDIIIRYGGDEFVIIFNNCTIKQALKIVKRITNASYGVGQHTDLSEAIKIADENMYLVKEAHHRAM